MVRAADWTTVIDVPSAGARPELRWLLRDRPRCQALEPEGMSLQRGRVVAATRTMWGDRRFTCGRSPDPRQAPPACGLRAQGCQARGGDHQEATPSRGEESAAVRGTSATGR